MNFDQKDFQRSADQLDDRYNPNGDGEHPAFTRWDWRQAVAQQNTISGYWVWVAYMLDQLYNEAIPMPDSSG